MQTKQRILDLLYGFAPALLVIIIPLFALGLLLDPPYEMVAGLFVLVTARLVRDPLFERLYSRPAPSHRAHPS